MNIHTTPLPPALQLSDATKTLYACQGAIVEISLLTGKVQKRIAVRGFVQPTLEGNGLYLSVSVHPETFVQCFRVSDGALVWSVPVQSRLAHAPVVADGTLYVCLVEGILSALEASTGRFLWSTPLDSRSERSPLAGPRVVSPPSMGAGIVYLATAVTPSLSAVRAADGMILWQVSTPGSTRFRLAVEEGVVYQSTAKGCCALDALTGASIWEFAAGARVCSSVAMMGKSAYLVVEESRYDQEHFLATGEMRQWWEASLCALQATDGSERWRVPIGVGRAGDYHLAANPVDGTVYVSAGTLAAFDADTGTRRWQFQSGETGLSCPIIAAEHVYVADGDGSVYALRADDGAVVWRTLVSTSTLVSSATALTTVVWDV